MKPFKLLQITHDLAIGGLQQVVVNICRTIDRTTFDVSVLCLRDLGALVPEIEKLGIQVHYLPQKETGTDYFSFLKVADILRKGKFDIIHTHNTQPFIDGGVAALMSNVKTFVHTEHGRVFPDKRRYMFAEWFVSRFAYKVVGVSSHMAESLATYEKIDRRKILCVPNGIDGTRYAININKAEKRRELGIAAEGPVIGLGVRLVEGKGIDYLLEAMVRVVEKHPGATLVIAGEGPYSETLKRNAAGLNLGRHVAFVGPRMDMPELLQLFDVYVLPSLSEGLPMVLLEALAAGCPVISTDVGGIPTAIRHEQTGLLVKPKDSDALAHAIHRFLSHERLREDCRANGLQVFQERYSARKMTETYQKLYLRQDIA